MHDTDSGSDASSTDSPTDRPLSDVVEKLEGDGFTGQFGARSGGKVLCFTCREEFAADAIDADEIRRLEGASDPAEESMTVPVTCPECATSGTLVLAYGPQAGEADADVMAALNRTPVAGPTDGTPEDPDDVVLS